MLLSLLLSTVLAASQQRQSDFVAAPDTLGTERQAFYQAISSQIHATPSIKARVNLRALDTLATNWNGNDDSLTGETYIFPAGHSDRVYVTGINPGWNAEQNITYNSVTCFSRVKGVYAAVWTVDWRDSQGLRPPEPGTGLAKLLNFNPERIDNKFVKDELARVRPYAMYRIGGTDSPWYSEFYDEQGNLAGHRADDGSKSSHVFNTLVEEQASLAHQP